MARAIRYVYVLHTPDGTLYYRNARTCVAQLFKLANGVTRVHPDGTYVVVQGEDEAYKMLRFGTPLYENTDDYKRTYAERAQVR